MMLHLRLAFFKRIIVSKAPERGVELYILDRPITERKRIELSNYFIFLAKMYMCIRPKPKSTRNQT